jgi:hypothetical protein
MIEKTNVLRNWEDLDVVVAGKEVQITVDYIQQLLKLNVVIQNRCKTAFRKLTL